MRIGESEDQSWGYFSDQTFTGSKTTAAAPGSCQAGASKLPAGAGNLPASAGNLPALSCHGRPPFF